MTSDHQKTVGPSDRQGPERSDHPVDQWRRTLAARRHELSVDAFAVALAVESTARYDGTNAVCSVDHILDYCPGMTRRTAERRLADLRALGLLAIVTRGGGRSRRATVYTLIVDETPATDARNRGASAPVDNAVTPASGTAERGGSIPVDNPATPATSPRTPATEGRTPATITRGRGAPPLPSVDTPPSPRAHHRDQVAAPAPTEGRAGEDLEKIKQTHDLDDEEATRLVELAEQVAPDRGIRYPRAWAASTRAPAELIERARADVRRDRRALPCSPAPDASDPDNPWRCVNRWIEHDGDPQQPCPWCNPKIVDRAEQRRRADNDALVTLALARHARQEVIA